MLSEISYIVVAMLLVSATLSIIFFIAWKTLGEKPHALNWSVGFLAATFQWFFTLQPSWFPSPETYWLTVNALALVLITLGIRGHCQRTGCRYLPDNLWPFAGTVYVGVVWTTVIDPHVGIATALIPMTACVALLLSAQMIVRSRQQAGENPRPAEWAVAISTAVFALTQAVAASLAVLQGAAGDDVYQALYVHFNFLTLPAGYMVTGMFVILMLASDISVEMKEIAIRDQLTGILNRRGLGEQGASAYANCRRTGRPVSVIMTDIDRFKTINDNHGHAVGDAALIEFAELLKEDRRAEDILARVGGEEFALILQGTDLQNALTIADGLCAKVDAHPIRVNDVNVSMTASFGVAAVSDKDTCLSDTIIRADRALYRCKRAGRNQVDLESSQLMLASDGTLKPANE